MMDDNKKTYTFKIDGLTPDSMPFGRLVDYYSEIAKMIGIADNMHLTEIVKSSHASQFKVDQSFETKIQERLIAIKENVAPKASLRAQAEINKMLAEDSTSGQFSSPLGENIIIFPGKRDDNQAAISIRDTATFTGELYHIAGSTSGAKIRITTDTYGVVFCSASKDIAKALRDFLFEDVRVSGRGLWHKTNDGQWTIDDFVITDFIGVRKESLSSAVNRLRKIDVDWPNDPIQELSDIEGSIVQ